MARDREKEEHEYKMRQLELTSKQMTESVTREYKSLKKRISLNSFNEKIVTIIDFRNTFKIQLKLKGEKIAEGQWFLYLKELFKDKARQAMSHIL